MRAALLALACLLCAGAARADCRLALALGLDVSGSVDAREYGLQRDGLAAALEAPGVRAAFLSQPAAPVRLAVFEWSGPEQQRLVVDWTVVDGPAALDRAAARLRATRSLYDDPATAIGAALAHGAGLLAGQARCWRRVLDISGDGPSNSGPHPAAVAGGAFSGVTVNGLVIGPRSRANTTKDLTNVKSLEGYYRAHVIRGPGAFVETARDFDDFARAMRRKLLRELAPPALSLRQ
jgi:hypothetical protein